MFDGSFWNYYWEYTYDVVEDPVNFPDVVTTYYNDSYYQEFMVKAYLQTVYYPYEIISTVETFYLMYDNTTVDFQISSLDSAPEINLQDSVVLVFDLGPFDEFPYDGVDFLGSTIVLNNL